MLTIPDSFFEEEERLNFTIPESMKHGWAIQLTVLDAVLKIAQKHDISIWLDYGSLMGAIRHKGYIPWDDDIDVCLLRSDYMKFLFLLREELPDFMIVYSFYTTDGYLQPKGFVASRENIDIGLDPNERKITELFHGCPYSTGLDLYPIDYVPSDEDQWNYVKQLYNAVYDLAMNMPAYEAVGELEDYILQLESLLNVQIKRGSGTRTALWKLADSIAAMTPREEAGFVMWYPDAVMCAKDKRRPVESYNKTLITDFEMLKVPVPSGYDAVLSSEYGANYMTPIRAGAAHDYPFYKIQEKKMLFHSALGQFGDIY